jgi:hypothetical protein
MAEDGLVWLGLVCRGRQDPKRKLAGDYFSEGDGALAGDYFSEGDGATWPVPARAERRDWCGVVAVTAV